VNGDAFSQIRLAAATHPHAYAFHKYWARKPHNVVRRALATAGVGRGSVVLDPFCGSGVPLSEAAELGAHAVGYDVNPVAVELTRLTLAPPDAALVRSEVGALLDALDAEFSGEYTREGRALRYAVHATVVACAACGLLVSADRSERRGRTHVCPRCRTRLHFNLEHLVATRRLRSVYADGSERSHDDEFPRDGAPPTRSGQPLPHNARILVFPGMRTSDLFTPRNFAVLSTLANRLALLPPSVRGAAKLTLTASVAQCSRLVAFRNDLTTGGPAWTVPGFWVPPLHLETNPLAHLRARLEKICRGIEALSELDGRSVRHRIAEGDARALLAEPALDDEPASLAFVDPPYGDSVPYLEFSALWNGFLGELPDPGLDIAVSNRARGDGTWQKYADDLGSIITLLRRRLRHDARVVITFNNKDPRAWRALSSALRGAGLRAIGEFYQRPAVVSAKAQLAPMGSYLGDFYGLFSLSD
jgi:DNA methylase